MWRPQQRLKPKASKCITIKRGCRCFSLLRSLAAVPTFARQASAREVVTERWEFVGSITVGRAIEVRVRVSSESITRRSQLDGEERRKYVGRGDLFNDILILDNDQWTNKS